jgi:hypothetical protein
MNIIIGVLLILFVSYCIYLFLAYLLSPKPFDRIGPDTLPLSKVTQVITSEELRNNWITNSGSTIVFYINPVIKERTAISGSEYASVVQIGSKQAFKILVAPDAGRGLTLAPAIFEIYVKGYTNPELVEITNFPLQRWTAVVIVKKGRRFNIYLNGKLSVSHTCTAMPDFDETQALRVGNPRLSGNISLMSIASHSLETNEVRDLIHGSVDASGKPYMPLTFLSFLWPILPSLPASWWCPGGNCTIPKRTGPLEEWISPYA